MASPAAVTNVLENATGVAVGVGRGVATAESGRQDLERRDPDAPSSSFLDVWTHTGSGLAARGERPVTEQLKEFSPPLIAALRALPHGAASAGAEGVADAVEAQAAQAWDHLLGAAGLGDPATAPSGALARIGAGFEGLIALEQLISTPFALIPFPAFPAIRVTDFDVGLPHGHTHPPNLVPPAPMVPLPSTGPIIPIPILSGSMRTLINGMPAARCGDFGLGIWCGGYVPLYEVFLGSSSVWIEGARAGRVTVDVTKHCIFSSPRPSDPPVGPPVGMTVTSSPNVLIGGVPLPSFLNLLMGGLVKGLFKLGGKALKKLKMLARQARRPPSAAVPPKAKTATVAGYGPDAPTVRTQYISTDGRPITVQQYRNAIARIGELERKGTIRIAGDRKFVSGARSDLVRIATTPSGRKALRNLEGSGKQMKVMELAEYNRAGRFDHGRRWKNQGPHCMYTEPGKAWQLPNGKPATGSDSVVRYDPGARVGAKGETPSDVVLMHELDHAQRAANGGGEGLHRYPRNSPLERDYTNPEEALAVANENAYRAERGGVKRRPNYREVD